jgi:photosystem II stability/assembly factor-like uncharacterized protein
MGKRILYYFLLWYALLGCRQEELAAPIIEYQFPTDLSLTDVHFLNNQQGFISAGNIFTKGLVFQTSDAGATWTLFDSFDRGIYSLNHIDQTLFIGETGQQVYQLNLNAPNGFNAKRVSGGWWPWHSKIVRSNGDMLFVGGENFGRGFVHQYTASTGSFVLTDTFNHELREIVQTPNGTIHAVGYGLVLRSTNQGQTWEVSTVQGDFFRGVSFPSNDIGYVVGEYGSVYKTTDGGQSWRNCRAGNSLFANPDKLLRDIAFLDEQTGFLVGTGSVVWRTTDGGQSWAKVTNLDFKTDYQKIEIYNGIAYLLGHYGQLFRVEL